LLLCILISHFLEYVSPIFGSPAQLVEMSFPEIGLSVEGYSLLLIIKQICAKSRVAVAILLSLARIILVA
jgi:hypothetical protein